MGYKFSDVEEGSRIWVSARTRSGRMDLQAVVKEHVKEGVAIISIDYDTNKRLNFDGVHVDLQYQEGDIPILWRSIQIVRYQSDYLVRVRTNGVKYNRRVHVRVGVSKQARLRVADGLHEVIIKEVSLSGFSIADKNGRVKLNVGEEATVIFEDLGFSMKLTGRVMRKEEQADMTVYGFGLTVASGVLPSYIQQKKRTK